MTCGVTVQFVVVVCVVIFNIDKEICGVQLVKCQTVKLISKLLIGLFYHNSNLLL